MDAAPQRTERWELAALRARLAWRAGNTAAVPTALANAHMVMTMLGGMIDDLSYIMATHAAAELHLLAGQLDEAWACAQQALDTLEAAPSLVWMEEVLFTCSRVAQARGAASLAADYLQRAYDRCQRVAAETQSSALRQAWRNAPTQRAITAAYLISMSATTDQPRAALPTSAHSSETA